MATRQDVLHVKTITDRTGDRVIVNFDEDPATDRFIALTADGATLCLGSERAHLGWAALTQLSELVTVSRKTFKPR